MALLLGGEGALAEVGAEVVGPPEAAALAATKQPRLPAHGVPVALAVAPHVVHQQLVLRLRPRPLPQPAAAGAASSSSFHPNAAAAAAPRHRRRSVRQLSRGLLDLLPSQPREQGRERESEKTIDAAVSSVPPTNEPPAGEDRRISNKMPCA